MKLQVPCPEVYVLTKMIINHERKPEKQRKDCNSIIRLLPFIDFSKFDSLYNASTKKERARVREFLEKHKEDISQEIPLDTKIKLSDFESRNFSNTIPHSKNNLSIEI